MPHDLTLSAVKIATVTVPDGGDARTSASVDTPFQQLANGVKYAQDALDGGNLLEHSYADITALKAVAPPAHGTMALIPGLTGSGAIAVYRFDGASTHAEKLPYVVTPGSAPVAGRWIEVVNHLLDFAAGASGTAVRVAADYVPMRLVSVTKTTSTSTYTQTPLGVWTDSGLISTAIAVLTGDIVEVDYTGTLRNDTTNVVSVSARIAGYDGSSTAGYTETETTLTPNGSSNTIGTAPVHLHTVETFGVDVAAWQAKVQLFAPNIAGGNAVLIPKHCIVVKVYRP